VDFVNFDAQEYSPDIETRETPGTPGILQTLRAALALQLKERLDTARIARRERELIERVAGALGRHPAVALMGGADLARGLPIFSLNVRVGDSWLHPRFVATLLNDLFGIQSRAGCSCAAPYGHRLLHIDADTSGRLARTIRRGDAGLKPGWTRLTFHFLHTDEEVAFLVDAIRFVADRGVAFLPAYRFDVHTGAWSHRGTPVPEPPFGIEAALAARATADAGAAGARPTAIDATAAAPAASAALFASYLDEARRLADEHERRHAGVALKTTEKDLVPFVYV
jgi:hypothetical protein